MPLNIPMPDLPGNALMKGLNTGSTLFSRYIEPVIKRQQMAQQQQQFGQNLNQRQAEQQQAQQNFLQELALRKQAEARMAQNSALNAQLIRQQIFEHELKTNPEKLFKFIQQIKQQSGANQQQANNPQPIMQENNMKPFSGGGMPSMQEMENPTPIGQSAMQNAPQTQPNGIFGDLTPDQQMMLQMAGIKVPTYKEDPRQKRFAELQNKIQFEDYKNQQKKIFEEDKAKIKTSAERSKTIQQYKDDLPILEQNLKDIQKLKKIATTKPDLFGHSGLWGFGAEGAAERFARTTDIPEAGVFLGLLTGPIAAGVQKLSARGNQLALKTQLGFKPGFGEQQATAVGKLNSMEEIAKEQIKHAKEIINEKSSGKNIESEKVIVIDPQGKRHRTTKENAKYLPKGWSIE